MAALAVKFPRASLALESSKCRSVESSSAEVWKLHVQKSGKLHVQKSGKLQVQKCSSCLTPWGICVSAAHDSCLFNVLLLTASVWVRCSSLRILKCTNCLMRQHHISVWL